MDFIAPATDWVWQAGVLLGQNDEAARRVTGISGAQWVTLVVAALVLILPFVIGGYLARRLKMPTHATRLGFILLAVIASLVVLANRRPKPGIDLRGGTILVYEIDPEKQNELEGNDGQRITSDDLVEPLTRRINPSGTAEIAIRPYGDSQIEIIIPDVNQQEVDRIKNIVSNTGQLRFAIVANQSDHQAIINLAIAQSESANPSIATRSQVGETEDLLYGRWVRIGREDVETDGVRPLRLGVGNSLVRNPRTGEIVTLPANVRGEDESFKIAKWLTDQEFSDLEILTVINSLLDITGKDLSYSASTFDQNGRPAVAFNLTDQGSGRFFALTTNNAPQGSLNRQLGIILDDVLLSAPNIIQPIRTEGRITGNFTRAEVDSLVAILKAGQLPTTVNPTPIAENLVGATLGADTIRKGVWAIGVSLVLVLLFVLVYYRFAGIIACFALVLNLAMILATMVFINQPMTLSGLAGLVLTVGMSVDANVLIFERIREEIKKGAKTRMAIRNGFARATTTIVDANLTTLITAFVLYAIGTDQIRGFAVTLILGILYSMFTAIYMSRTLFDIAERHGKVSLSMSDGVNSMRQKFAGGGHFNFIGAGKFSLVLSAILVIIGLGALFARGRSIQDIDFAGGSSVQFQLEEPTATAQVRAALANAFDAVGDKTQQFTVSSVTLETAEDRTVYKVDSSLDQVSKLQTLIEQAFAAGEPGLVKYKVEVKPQGLMSIGAEDNGIRLVAFQADDNEADLDPGPLPEAVADPDAAAEMTATVSIAIEGKDSGAELNGSTLRGALISAGEATGIPINDRLVQIRPVGQGAENWAEGSALNFDTWEVTLPLTVGQGNQVLDQLRQNLSDEPVWISSSSVGARVAGDMISRALGALFASLLAIIGYIWFRFQRVAYGVAAVVALVHDVAITLGAIAISYWLADVLDVFLIDPFKISLTVVAALLTIIGYSLNDTIVVFDRIRETKGKAPRLTGEMVNESINQTLSRTLLTSLTTLIVVVLLYFFGGEGIHAFAFALVVGVVVGTYSSVFVASPVLLWLIERDQRKAGVA